MDRPARVLHTCMPTPVAGRESSANSYAPSPEYFLCGDAASPGCTCLCECASFCAVRRCRAAGRSAEDRAIERDRCDRARARRYSVPHSARRMASTPQAAAPRGEAKRRKVSGAAGTWCTALPSCLRRPIRMPRMRELAVYICSIGCAISEVLLGPEHECVLLYACQQARKGREFT